MITIPFIRRPMGKGLKPIKLKNSMVRRFLGKIDPRYTEDEDKERQTLVEFIMDLSDEEIDIFSRLYEEHEARSKARSEIAKEKKKQKERELFDEGKSVGLQSNIRDEDLKYTFAHMDEEIRTWRNRAQDCENRWEQARITYPKLQDFRYPPRSSISLRTGEFSAPPTEFNLLLPRGQRGVVRNPVPFEINIPDRTNERDDRMNDFDDDEVKIPESKSQKKRGRPPNSELPVQIIDGQRVLTTKDGKPVKRTGPLKREQRTGYASQSKESLRNQITSRGLVFRVADSITKLASILEEDDKKNTKGAGRGVLRFKIPSKNQIRFF